MPDIRITQHMLDNITYDTEFRGPSEKVSKKMTQTNASCECTHTVLIVADNADFHSAAYHLAQSLQSPFGANLITTVLVAETARTTFLECLKPKLISIHPEVAQNTKRNNILSLIAKNKWETISVSELGTNSPIIVCDVTHDHLGTGYNGIVTLHTFRTIQESISLCAKETLKPAVASIWTSNHASAYEIAMKIGCETIYINCHEVSLEAISAAAGDGGSCALIENNYHYETLLLDVGWKVIVFPIGTSITN